MLRPLKIVGLLALTLLLSIAGIVLLVAGVHGPQIMSWIGAFLLLPSTIMNRLGVPIAIPVLHTSSLLSLIVFIISQTVYYYLLLQIGEYLFDDYRRKRSQ